MNNINYTLAYPTVTVLALYFMFMLFQQDIVFKSTLRFKVPVGHTYKHWTLLTVFLGKGMKNSRNRNLLPSSTPLHHFSSSLKTTVKG